MKLPLRRLKVAILKLPLLYVHVVVGTAAKLVNVTFRLCEAVDRLNNNSFHVKVHIF